MATTTGNSGAVFIGSYQVAEVRSFTVNENADRIEDTVLGDSNRTYKSGLADVNGTIECYYDSSDTTGQEAMTVGSTISLDLRPAGTGTGLPSWTVSASLTEISTETQFNEIITRSFNWAAAGTLTKGVQ